MVAQVAAVRIDMSWSSRKGLVACIASLTRALSVLESRRMSRFPEFEISGDRVTYSCRGEEAEAFGKRLGALLRAAARAPVRRRARHAAR